MWSPGSRREVRFGGRDHDGSIQDGRCYFAPVRPRPASGGRTSTSSLVSQDSQSSASSSPAGRLAALCRSADRRHTDQCVARAGEDILAIARVPACTPMSAGAARSAALQTKLWLPAFRCADGAPWAVR
jgi:hypothetical protein